MVAVAAPATTARRAHVIDRYEHHVNRALASMARVIAAPVEARSAGTKVYGDDGTEYLDYGGFGVFLLGHCHPAVVGAVRPSSNVIRWPPGCS